MPAEKPILKPSSLLPPAATMALIWAVPMAAYGVTKLMDNSMRRPPVAAFVGHMLSLF